ncbi:hypothetical protein [Devosia sp. CAU 1758]
MADRNHLEAQPSLAGITGQASLHEWLIGLTHIRRRPQPVPLRLYADLGLAPPHERHWVR